MTRKDYINIAAAILAAQARIKNNTPTTGPERGAQLRGVRRAAAHLADFLAQDNPRFDKGRFLTECGYGATEGEEQHREAAYERAQEHPDPATRRWLTTHNAPR